MKMSAQSPVYTATKDTLFDKKNAPIKHALSLQWVYGRSPSLPVHCLQDQDQLMVLYAASNVGVIYNHSTHSQHLLQGHNSSVSSLCVSEDRRWICTADSGPGPVVIVWDCYSGIPVCTLFDCHQQQGVSDMAFSEDTRYLLILGSQHSTEDQHICLWDWTNDIKKPVCCADINPKYGYQRNTVFSPRSSGQFVMCSDSHVLLWTMEEGKLSCCHLKLKKQCGAAVASVFHWSYPHVVTATDRGNMAIWDLSKQDKKVTVVHLQEVPFTTLTVTDSYAMTGDTEGHVKVYGLGFRPLALFLNLQLGPITSVSFAHSTTGGLLTECPLEKTQVIIRNFVVSSVESLVLHVNAETEETETLLDEDPEPLRALCCHPSLPLLVTGSNCGTLKLRDHTSKRTVCKRQFKMQEGIHCGAYDKKGQYLAVGLSSGSVYILDPGSLRGLPDQALRLGPDPITHLGFSEDALHLAAADSGYAVTVLRFSDGGWQVLGRHRSHYSPIQSLLFGLHLDSTLPRLLSLGLDRRLVEYDLCDSGSGSGLKILSSLRLEQTALPLSMTWCPPLTKEQFILITTDQYKIKLINSTTFMCRSVVRGPTFGSPVQRAVVLPKSKEDKNYYMTFINQDKVGVQVLPADGNPYWTQAVVCHPSGVSSLCVSAQGHVFTGGQADCSVLSWDISTQSLEAVAALGGTGMEPFYSLLEGGRDGAFYREMEEFFYYIQVRHQGLTSRYNRTVSTHIPLSELSAMMRAIGFYPTEREIEDMQNEVRYSAYSETGRYVTELDLDHVIRLYLNHRPVVRESETQWKNLSDLCGERDALLHLLQTTGEAMTEDEILQCFSTLLDLTDKANKLNKSSIPVELSAETLTQILGFSSATDQPPPNSS